MNSLNEDMMREVAYFMNMRSFAAMSMVNRAWNAALSDRRVRARVRLCNFARAEASPVMPPSRNMENWHHLKEIGREVRFIHACLKHGKCYVSRLFTQKCAVRKAWYALDTVLRDFRSGAATWACVLYPIHFRKYEHLWKQDLFYSRKRYEYTTKEITDFSKLFASYERLNEGVDSAPPHGHAKKKKHLLVFFTSEERAAFAKFIAYFRESAELWRKYFATSVPLDWAVCAGARISREKLPAAIEVLERAIENVGSDPSCVEEK